MFLLTPKHAVVCCGFLSVLLYGCDGSMEVTDLDRVADLKEVAAMGPAGTLERRLAQLIEQNELTGNPASGRSLPDVTSPAAQLGVKLFFSKNLSGNRDTACVSCHHPMLGGGDGLALPIGVDAMTPELLGPGRLHSRSAFTYDGGPTVPRNAPTTFNIGLWDRSIFYDGRLQALQGTPGLNGAGAQGIRTPLMKIGVADSRALNLAQAQAMFPPTSPEEMRHDFMLDEEFTNLHEVLADRFAATPEWQAEFATVFEPDANGEVVTTANISFAIGEYERSQVLVENAWKRYVEGDSTALTLQQKLGAYQFFTAVKDGGAGCSACHLGDLFTDEQFHVSAFPQLGRGKGDGDFGDADFGRFRETGMADDKFAFRTPSLLNVEYTGPYGHAGSFTTLQEVIQYHSDPVIEYYYFPFNEQALSDNVQTGIQSQNAAHNTTQARQQMEQLINNNKSLLVPRYTDERRARHLVSFMQALSDKRIEDREFMSRWIAAPNELDYDNSRLNPRSENDQSL